MDNGMRIVVREANIGMSRGSTGALREDGNRILFNSMTVAKLLCQLATFLRLADFLGFNAIGQS